MADELDRAADAEAVFREKAIARQRDNAEILTGQGQASATFCIDCELAIPAARRAVGGIQRCIQCQTQQDRAGRHPRFTGRYP